MDDEYIYDPSIKPYLVQRMTGRRLHGYNTICSTISDMYVLANNDPKLELLCRIVMRVSKNLYLELRKYWELTGKELGGMVVPYKRRHPVPEHEMDISRYAGHHSICQTLRDIYHTTENEEIKLKCRIAMAMAKAMNDRLKYYKSKELNG